MLALRMPNEVYFGRHFVVVDKVLMRSKFLVGVVIVTSSHANFGRCVTGKGIVGNHIITYTTAYSSRSFDSILPLSLSHTIPVWHAASRVSQAGLPSTARQISREPRPKV